MKCCKTCKWSRWILTPTGQIQRNTTGQCIVPLPLVPMPDCITKRFDYRKYPSRSYMDKDEGKECPLYEENEGKPIKEGTP